MRSCLALLLLVTSGCFATDSHERTTTSPLADVLILGGAALLAAANEPPPRPQNPVIVQVAAPAPARIVAPPPAALEGILVSDVDDRSDEMALMLLRLSDGHSVTVLTKANRHGRFRFPAPLPPGRYLLEIIDESWAGQADVELSHDGAPAVLLRARPMRR